MNYFSACPFICDTYGKLWHHFQKHKKISRFTCTKCTFSAGSFSCLSEHVILHARDPPASASSSSMTTNTNLNFGLPPTLDNSITDMSQELLNGVYDADDFPPEIDEYRIASTASDSGTNGDDLSQDNVCLNLVQGLLSSNLQRKLSFDFDKAADIAIASQMNFLDNVGTLEKGKFFYIFILTKQL